MKNKTDLLLECVTERDIDLLILEELNTSSDFVIWFLGMLGISLVQIDDVVALHSVTGKNGESDIEMNVASGNSLYHFLIENKIDAQAQPEQAKRYMERAAEKNAITVIIAPNAYLKINPEVPNYNYKISYEDISGFFKRQNTVQGAYKFRVLEQAITKQKRGYTPIINKYVTDFWIKYCDELKKYVPDAKLSIDRVKLERNGKPAGADWPQITFSKLLPEKWYILHKMYDGHIDLVTMWNDNEAEKFKVVLDTIKDIALLKVGNNYTFRLAVPELDRFGNFEDQINNLHKCFDALKALKQLMK